MSDPTRAKLDALQAAAARADAVSKLYAASRDALGDDHPSTLALLPELRATRREVEAARGGAWCHSPLGPACPLCAAARHEATEARAAARLAATEARHPRGQHPQEL
jgi:hypothetical protein